MSGNNFSLLSTNPSHKPTVAWSKITSPKSQRRLSPITVDSDESICRTTTSRASLTTPLPASSRSIRSCCTATKSRIFQLASSRDSRTAIVAAQRERDLVHSSGRVPRLVESQPALALRQQHSVAAERNFRVLAANTNNVSVHRGEEKQNSFLWKLWNSNIFVEKMWRMLQIHTAVASLRETSIITFYILFLSPFTDISPAIPSSVIAAYAGWRIICTRIQSRRAEQSARDRRRCIGRRSKRFAKRN